MSSTMNNENNGNNSDIHFVLNEDVNHGGSVRKLAIQKKSVCDLCIGTGRRDGTDDEYEDCEHCWGAGIVETYNKDAKKQVHIQCRECRGEGQTIPMQHRCEQCAGKRYQQDRFILAVDIKQGMYCGKKIAREEEKNQEVNLNFDHLNTILEEIKHNQDSRSDDAEPSFA